MKRVLLLIILALIALSGCPQQDIRPTASQLPEIKAFIEEHQGGEMNALYMSEEAVYVILNDIRADCNKDIPIVPYWYVTVQSTGELGEFYVDERVEKVICVVRNETAIIVEHECGNASQCNDDDPSTKDKCEGIPRKCTNTQITNCENNDSYCPPSCVHQDDNDCPAIDLCQSDFDCTDSNRFTKDSCTGTPKACRYELKTCDELNEHLCEIYEECKATQLPSKDNKVCCNQECSQTESCEGVNCPTDQKCVRGNCIDKTCAERELPLCTSSERCTEDFFKDDLGITCCTGECRTPCDSDANCSSTEACRNDYCIAKSCEEIGGKECNTTTEECVGDKERTLDAEECCFDCALKTCEEREGIECEEESTCSQNTVETLDTAECCLATCEEDLCFDTPCAVNRKCVEDECVLKTCEEMSGINWEDQASCQGSFFETSGVKNCCIEHTCEELGGLECQVDETCSVETVLSTDTADCCTGNCQP